MLTLEQAKKVNEIINCISGKYDIEVLIQVNDNPGILQDALCKEIDKKQYTNIWGAINKLVNLYILKRKGWWGHFYLELTGEGEKIVAFIKSIKQYEKFKALETLLHERRKGCLPYPKKIISMLVLFAQRFKENKRPYYSYFDVFSILGGGKKGEFYSEYRYLLKHKYIERQKREIGYGMGAVGPSGPYENKPTEMGWALLKILEEAYNVYEKA